MVKKITAPKSYDPGKGRPREHLAYLNEREMAYLRSINGNNMERGPRGLPSFPPDDSIGSSSRAGGSRGPGGPSGPNSGPSRSTGGLGGGGKGSTGGGNRSGVGGGGGGGGGATGSRGSSTGSVGSRSGSQAPGNRGAGGQGSVVSGTRTGSSISSRTGGYKGPSSPMSGQGASFSSPVFALGSNRDYIDRQKVATKAAANALTSTKALKTDLQVGGIRSLNVGPMGKPVNVYKPLSAAKVPGPRVAPAQPRKYEAPLTPGMTPEDMARRGAIMDQYEREIRDIMRGTPTRTGDPISAGGLSPQKPASPSGMGYSGASFDPESPIQQSAVDRAIINTAIARSLGPATRPASQVSPKPASADISGAGYGTFNVPDVGFENRLRDMMKPDIGIPEPPSPFSSDERILAIENLPEERPRIAAGTYTSPYDLPSKPSISKREQMALDMQNQYLGLDQEPYKEPKKETLGRLNDVFDQYGLRTPKVAETLTDDIVDSPYLSPTTQMPPDQLPEKPLPVRMFEKTLFGKIGKGMSWTAGKEYESLSPQARADVMERWAKQNAAYLRGGAIPGGVKSQTAGGGAPDIGSGGKSQYRPGPGSPPYLPPPPVTEQAETGRPQKYYNWDVGVGIPSPGDSDYTLYLKYLEEKAAARAAV